MNTLLNSKNLPFLTLLLGGVGCGLRRLLYSLTVDGKNLIPAGHPLALALWAVTAVAAIWILVRILPLRYAEQDSDRFRPDAVAALGSLAAAVGIGLTVLLSGENTGGILGLFWKLLGLVSAAAMLAAAVCRFRGQVPFFGFHAIVCVFFAVHMVCCYRGWSGNPQLMDYVFSLFSGIGLMLFAFYHGCLEAGMGNLRLLPASGLMSAYCCMVALSGTDFPLLYLGGVLWTLTNLYSLHTEV